MNEVIYFECANCGRPVNKENLSNSYTEKRLCPKCKDEYFFEAVKQKILSSEKTTLEYLQMFFSGNDAIKYGWTKGQCSYLLSMIQERLKEIIPLSKLLMRNEK